MLWLLWFLAQLLPAGAITGPATAVVAIPSFSPGTGNYVGDQTVTISDSTPLAVICYTLDGSTPTATMAGTCSNGTTYTVPVSVTSSATPKTLKAIGTLVGDINSGVGSAVYTFVVFVQTTDCSWSSGSSYPCTLGSSPVAGHILTLMEYGNPTTATISSISSTGAAWALLTGAQTTMNRDAEIWCATLSGSPSPNVTVNLNGSPTTASANVQEWAGKSTCTLDGTAQLQTGTSLTPSTANLTSSNAVDILLAMVARSNSGSTFSSQSGGYNSLSSLIGTTLFVPSYQLVSSTGVYGTTWTYTGGSATGYDSVSVALK